MPTQSMRSGVEVTFLVHVQVLKDVAVDLSELSGSSKLSQLDHACVEYSRNSMFLPPILGNCIYASKPLIDLFQKERKSENFFVCEWCFPSRTRSCLVVSKPGRAAVP